jgi:hypothetical protein
LTHGITLRWLINRCCDQSGTGLDIKIANRDTG